MPCKAVPPTVSNLTAALQRSRRIVGLWAFRHKRLWLAGRGRRRWHHRCCCWCRCCWRHCCWCHCCCYRLACRRRHACRRHHRCRPHARLSSSWCSGRRRRSLAGRLLPALQHCQLFVDPLPAMKRSVGGCARTVSGRCHRLRPRINAPLRYTALVLPITACTHPQPTHPACLYCGTNVNTPGMPGSAQVGKEKEVIPSCTSLLVVLPVRSSGPPESPKQMFRCACRPVGRQGRGEHGVWGCEVVWAPRQPLRAAPGGSCRPLASAATPLSTPCAGWALTSHPV